jgi:hypothetical protein
VSATLARTLFGRIRELPPIPADDDGSIPLPARPDAADDDPRWSAWRPLWLLAPRRSRPPAPASRRKGGGR